MARREDPGVAELRRVEGQRTLFVMLPVSRSVENLKAAMMERAGWFIRCGREAEALALLEFLPSPDARKVLEPESEEDLRDLEIARERLGEIRDHPERLHTIADLKREIEGGAE